MKETLFLKNTEAFAESMIRCGIRCHFAYPITPATDVMKYTSRMLPEVGGRMVQMESELAVSNALAGYACAGKLGATSSSGPGMTLMQEAIGFMAAGELPCIMLDAMRVGPGDGDIIGAQSTYYQATRGGGHGDYRVIVLAPSCGQEIAELMPHGIKLALTYLTPVLFVVDGVTCQMTETTTFDEPYDYTADFDTSSWAYTGTADHPKRFLLTGSYTHEQGYEMNERMRRKYVEISENEQMWEQEKVDDAEVLVVAFGIHGRMCKDLVESFRAQGKRVGSIRPITLWPFPNKAFESIPASVKSILVVEMNHGQMVDDVRLAVNGRVPVHFLGKTGGDIPMCTLADMTREASRLLEGE
ncbi:MULTISPECIES: pyruvate ferredoxin oxidoreductase [unclassified Pseudodesulfovibrio]|uniref:pyruvate ferredoxin oxidoreductase n=1 Tax=unclassified Pseudodesulfovibrio TaxID=2661612 RepID=UPI000FEBF2DB|nr:MULTISPECIES: pyruvate ferredoxin oxidoreductase [unclassified Pseudodesulfovibrio]MCJ2165484.1 pyruvate ferredoxin oxidoreductase [Pseudodesulfovibrio sp. S3-i]RWU03233.1 pyruvate ferredoxin oxidoreductase [Pseudodesulfovibrio sp. S3]